MKIIIIIIIVLDTPGYYRFMQWKTIYCFANTFINWWLHEYAVKSIVNNWLRVNHTNLNHAEQEDKTT